MRCHDSYPSRLASTEHPRRRRDSVLNFFFVFVFCLPRCRRDSTPRNSHVAAAASPRLFRDVSAPRKVRGASDESRACVWRLPSRLSQTCVKFSQTSVAPKHVASAAREQFVPVRYVRAFGPTRANCAGAACSPSQARAPHRWTASPPGAPRESLRDKAPLNSKMPAWARPHGGVADVFRHRVLVHDGYLSAEVLAAAVRTCKNWARLAPEGVTVAAMLYGLLLGKPSDCTRAERRCRQISPSRRSARPVVAASLQRTAPAFQRRENEPGRT